MPLVGVKGTVKRIAPTEQVELVPQGFNEDFNYEMVDGSWTHLEFESDSISEDDLRRFHVYEAIISYNHKVKVYTCVLCSSNVKKLRKSLEYAPRRTDIPGNPDAEKGTRASEA